ncbi:MAG: NAD+ synthase [Gemmatimonadetes bacterium]|nr:NAD+ synthase [Gemmatimonadota bacterium]
MLRLALAQFRPDKGNVEANVRRIGEIVAQAAALDPAPHVVQFAETVLSGYFVEGGVRETAVRASDLAQRLAKSYAAGGGNRPIDVVLGFYEELDGTLHNSAAYLALDGAGGARVVHLHRKNFLPTYGLFDEERFVERGFGFRAFDTRWGRAAILVCEDAWHSLSGTIAALDGAQMIFVVAAAPARGMHDRRSIEGAPATVARWDRLVLDIAEEHGVFCSLANLVGSEGGKVFPGASVVMGPRGTVCARAPLWDEALVTADLELADIGRARTDAPMLSDLKVALPTLRAELERVANGAVAPVVASGSVGDATGDPGSPPRGDRAARAVAPAAVSAPLAVIRSGDTSRSAPPPLEIDPTLVEGWLVAFLRDEFRRRGFNEAVIGLSGGVDSAVTATLAARAFGPQHVHAVRMPYRTSSPDSLAHAQLVIDQLGLRERTLDISAAVDGYLTHEPDASPARRGNVMARMRMITLFDLAAKHGALPLGTGNKSERLLGYFTWHADDSPPVNPIGDLFKTQVWALAKHLGVPDAIVQKPASADLIEGQTDEGDFGISYARADAILNWLLHGYTAAEVARRGFSPEEIARVRARLDSTHWKRRLPTVALLSTAAIGESYLRPVDY